MKHFELAEWTDFVRGLVEKSARLPLEHHLANRETFRAQGQRALAGLGETRYDNNQ